MPQDDGIKRWIVIINRAPHGPLTKEEITVLLQQRIIRRNDVACIANSSQNGWKFLWQFEEFDRRSVKSESMVPVSLSNVGKERRTKPPPELTAEAIPTELLKISPEDLILKSNQRPPTEREPSYNEMVIRPQRPRASFTFPSLPLPSAKTLGFSTGGLLLFALAWAIFKDTKKPEFTLTPVIRNPADDPELSTREALNGPLAGPPRSNRRQLPPVKPSAAADPVAAPPPRETTTYEPERGEIREPSREDEELAGDEEVTEQDIIEARAFKKKQLSKKGRPRRPAAVAAEEEEGPASEDPAPLETPDFPE